jgi:hypothetical protein
MTTLEATSLILISVIGSAACLLAVRGLRRTKNVGFLILACLCAVVAGNGIARVHEFGDGITPDDRHSITHLAKLRALEPPVFLAMLGFAAFLFQKDDKRC